MHVTIKISAVGDPPLYPEVGKLLMCEGTLESLGILEAGMESGKASVSMNVRLPTGEFVVVQCSAAIFHAIDSALRGAEQRFDEARQRN